MNVINILKTYTINTVKTAIPYISRYRSLIPIEEVNAVTRLVIYTEKLFRAKQQLIFLLRCRSSDLIPRFINHSVHRISKQFTHGSIITTCKRFKHSLLNISIRDTHSRINHYHALLERSHRTQITDDFLLNFTINIVSVIEKGTTIHAKKKLIDKFQLLRVDAETDLAIKAARSASDQAQVSVFNPVNRVTVLDDTTVLSKQEMSVLSKGPGFVPSTKVDKQTVLEAVVGVEKLAYGMKWNLKINSNPMNLFEHQFGSCQEPVSDSNSILCDGPCKSWFHDGCSSLSKADFRLQMDNTDMKWLCSECASIPSDIVCDDSYRPEDKCAVCNEFVRSFDKGIRCDNKCDKWHHRSCINMSMSQFNHLSASEDKWSCGVCISKSAFPSDLNSTPTDEQVFVSTFTRENTIFPSDMPFKDIPKYQPKIINRSLNEKLNNLKVSIQNIYESHIDCKLPDNLSPADRLALKSLKNKAKGGVIFKVSDKGKGFVAMQRETYSEKCLQHLEDPVVYKQLKAGPLSGSKKRVMTTVNNLDGKLPQSTINVMKPNNTNLGEFYGLPKTHKAGHPIRPIISAINTPVEKLSFPVTKILVQCQKLIPTLVRDSSGFLSRLRSSFPDKIPPSSILFSMDISAMYTNIPLEDCKLKILNFISSHSADVTTFGLGFVDLENMLHTVMNESFFRFGEKVFHQKLGLGMGHRYSPPGANVYVHILELELLEAWNSQHSEFFINILNWFRALDDIFSIWEYGEASLILFLDFANNFHPTIKFTLERSYTSLNYLDITISKDGDSASQLTTELFIKPSHSGVSLNYNSKHPRHVILNTGRNHFRRAKLLSSSSDARARSYKKISDLLLANNYPQHVINLMRSEMDASQESRAKDRTGTRFTLTLPFRSNGILDQCKGALKLSKLSNVQIASKPPPNLKKTLIRTPFEPRKCPRNCASCATSDGKQECTSRMVVYQLVCSICLESYIGETSRCLHQRVSEHLAATLKETEDLTISTHFQTIHPEIPIKDRYFKSSIIQKCTDYRALMITEAILISELDPSLNVYSGKWTLIN